MLPNLLHLPRLHREGKEAETAEIVSKTKPFGFQSSKPRPPSTSAALTTWKATSRLECTNTRSIF